MITIEFPSSSSVRSIRYDVNTNLLQVNYTNGRWYEYLQVPDRCVDELKSVVVAGGSVGNYIIRQIQPRFKYREIVSSVLEFKRPLKRDAIEQTDWFKANLQAAQKRDQRLASERAKVFNQYKKRKSPLHQP